jgi:hypothetical protein
MYTATIHQLVPQVLDLPPELDMTTYAISAIADWQPERPYYHVSEISYRIGVPISRHLTFALKLNQWVKVRIRTTEHTSEGIKRPVQSVWQPPGATPIRKRPRGRPSYMQLIHDAISGNRF